MAFYLVRLNEGKIGADERQIMSTIYIAFSGRAKWDQAA
jgi:hypothetical protein